MCGFGLLANDLACRAAHHGLDLRDFILDRLACAFRFFRASGPFRFCLFPCFFRTGGFFSHPCHFRLLRHFGSRLFLGRMLLPFLFLPFSLKPLFFSRFTLFGFLLADRFRFGSCLFFGLQARLLFRFHLRLLRLSFAQLGFLACDQLGLTACFFGTTLFFSLVDHRSSRLSLFDFGTQRLFVAFDKRPFFSDFDLNRSGFAGRIGLLDFARFLASQRNLAFFAALRAMHTAQIVQQLVLVFLAQDIIDRLLFHAGIAQLFQQHVRRHIQFGSKLGYIVNRHSFLFLPIDAANPVTGAGKSYRDSISFQARACNSFASSSYLASISFISSSVTSANSFSSNWRARSVGNARIAPNSS